MTYPKDIKISQREQFALLNDPDFLNQAVTRFLVSRSGDQRFYRQNPTNARHSVRAIVTIVKTRVGRIELSVPQDREGRFHICALSTQCKGSPHAKSPRLQNSCVVPPFQSLRCHP